MAGFVESFGSVIRRARNRSGLTQSEVAAGIGVSDRTLGIWEHGEVPRNKHQRVPVIAKMSTVLGIKEARLWRLLHAGEKATLSGLGLEYLREQERRRCEALFMALAAARGLKPLGRFVGSRKRVWCRCPAGHTCQISLNGLQGGRIGCVTCSLARRGASLHVAAKERFLRWAEASGYTLVGQYTLAHICVEVLCPSGHRRSLRPRALRLVPCGECIRQERSLESRFVAGVLAWGGVVLGQYVDAKTPVDCRCPHGHLWSAAPGRFLRGARCTYLGCLSGHPRFRRGSRAGTSRSG